MYKRIFRPLLFLFSPETIHGLVGGGLRFVCAVPGGRALLRAIFNYKDAGLEREVFGIKFRNPVGLAAGFDKDARLWDAMGALGFGFVEVGTVTPKAQPGNPRPRSFRLRADSALINRMGFNNHGAENMARHLRKKRRGGLVVGVNLGKNSTTPNDDAPADYLGSFEKLYDLADYFAINVSCPNVRDLTALQNRGSVMSILEPLFEYRKKQKNYRPILLKISPDLGDEQVDMMTDIMLQTPLDGMIATNTTTSREGLHTPRKTVEAIGNGGLSGGPLTARSVEVVRRVHLRSGGAKPIIGVGGVMAPEDARRMLDAGASLVQVYTGFIYNGPAFVRRICKFLAAE
jgi:dihydroorotate dehydrogenase